MGTGGREHHNGWRQQPNEEFWMSVISAGGMQRVFQPMCFCRSRILLSPSRRFSPPGNTISYQVCYTDSAACLPSVYCRAIPGQPNNEVDSTQLIYVHICKLRLCDGPLVVAKGPEIKRRRTPPEVATAAECTWAVCGAVLIYNARDMYLKRGGESSGLPPSAIYDRHQHSMAKTPGARCW